MGRRLDPQTKQELKELLAELGPDTLFLLFSNITVIILAMVQNWNITPLLWVYWWQSIIIGFFNWRRIKKLQKFSTEGLKIDGESVPATVKTRKSTARFFLLTTVSSSASILSFSTPLVTRYRPTSFSHAQWELPYFSLITHSPIVTT